MKTEDFNIMFLTETDLGTTIYNYQIEEITDGNNDIVIEALAAAEEEIRSYLSGNNKKEWNDGRPKYDVDLILSASGTARSKLLVRHGSTITKWYIVELCSYDVIYETAKDRYDRAVAWLNKLAKGEINLSTLPTITEEPEGSTDETTPFVYGSRTKFTHE